MQAISQNQIKRNVESDIQSMINEGYEREGAIKMLVAVIEDSEDIELGSNTDSLEDLYDVLIEYKTRDCYNNESKLRGDC